MKWKIRNPQRNQNWFSKTINEIDKPLARLTKKKERTQIINSRSERRNITIGPMDIKRMIKEYYFKTLSVQATVKEHQRLDG